MKNIRLIVLIASFLGSFVAVSWVRSGYEFEVEAPSVPLSAIPLKAGVWTGRDVVIQEDTVRVLGAHSHINRVYRDPIGRSVAFHAAVWTDPEFGAKAPHHPEICYPSAGWEIMERRESSWTLASVKVPVELMLFQRGKESAVTAHWYQTGDVRFTNSGEIQSQLFRLWGKKKWACTEKILLHTTLASFDKAEPVLKQLAAELLAPDSEITDQQEANAGSP